ncbi:MAG TPA: tripartite tricarboxylate transporter substrate binding protein [Burkholderiales bacterium]|nr:tripartite tricarboxylate transporter substrate binding protein [Burkholderiales bacterium]
MPHRLHFVAALAWLASAFCHAQDFPNKPFHLLVPYPAGGPTDAISRLLAERMKDGLGQAVIVENRPGGGTLLAAEAAVRAAPDGYTWLYTSAQMIIAAELNPPAFDIYKDLAPIAQFSKVYPLMWVVHESVPAKNVAQLSAYAKAKPGGITMAYSGYSAPAYLFGQLLNRTGGLPVTLVGYKGQVESQNDMLAGRIDAMFLTLAPVADAVKAGKLRVLATMGDERSPQTPEIPTLAEAGLPDVAFPYWNGLHTVGGTPRAVIARLDQAVAAAIAAPRMAERMRALSFQPSYADAAGFGVQFKRDAERLRKLLDESGVLEQARRDAGIKGPGKAP